MDSAQIESLLQSKKDCLKLLYFTTDSSPECQQMTDVVKELEESGEYNNVTFIGVETGKADSIVKKFEVNCVPAFIFHFQDKELGRFAGANAPALVKKLNSAVAKTTSLSNDSNKDLNSRLKDLINRAPCMLFMKGSPDNPKCGFSRQTISLLQSHNAEFETFDILTDMDVREGLKKYSNWPTYPQLYIKGDLIGGLDIMKELSENGELASLLEDDSKKTEDLNSRLKKLINRSPIMIFMKGSPDMPRCGFSKTLIELMSKLNVTYDTFDILSDNTVREGLKVFSDWPTYPQVYAKGNLIGGLDIIKELDASGDLVEALTAV